MEALLIISRIVDEILRYVDVEASDAFMVGAARLPIAGGIPMCDDRCLAWVIDQTGTTRHAAGWMVAR